MYFRLDKSDPLAEYLVMQPWKDAHNTWSQFNKLTNNVNAVDILTQSHSH